MNYCSKCGSVIPEGVSFCPKCGMPVGQSANKATAQMPARPQMPKPARPQMPQPATPQMSKPAMPQMPKPARPQMPQPAGTDKGFFTNAVRTVAKGELVRMSLGVYVTFS